MFGQDWLQHHTSAQLTEEINKEKAIWSTFKCEKKRQWKWQCASQALRNLKIHKANGGDRGVCSHLVVLCSTTMTPKHMIERE